MPGVNFQAMLAAKGVTNTLTQKGYGIASAPTTNTMTLNYSTVTSGSAPVAGDLVCWILVAMDTVATPIVDLTGSGWVQTRTSDGGSRFASQLAKIVTASDVSAPPNIVTGPTQGAYGVWVAYTVSGSPTLTSNSFAGNSDPNVPTNETADSSALSAPDVAITLSLGSGDDGSPSLTWAGATEDISVTTLGSDFNGDDVIVKIGADIGGASVTVSKGDDGTINTIWAGYIGVDF